MANLLTYIELQDERPTPASLETLGEGRRIASYLGATLYALLPCRELPTYSDEDLVAMLGRHGADKVIVITGPEFAGSPLYATHGTAAAKAMNVHPPALALFPDSACCRDLAPRLATKLGGAFVSGAAIGYSSDGELAVSASTYGGTHLRTLSTADFERPIVVTLRPGSYKTCRGVDDAEVVVLSSPNEKDDAALEFLSSETDSGWALESAQRIVCAGAGCSDSDWGMVQELAEALDAELAVTDNASRGGRLDASRVVGVSGRSVSPQLYVVCGASGSQGHLSAVSRDSEIIAFNTDPNAPIFGRAAYGMVGDLESTLPAFVAALRDQK